MISALSPLNRAPCKPADDDTEQLWNAIKSEFLLLISWSAHRQVLTFPREHPQLGWRECFVAECDSRIYTLEGLCAACALRWKQSGRPDIGEFVTVPRIRHREVTPGRCVVEPCQRPWESARTGLCSAHEGARERRKLPVDEFLALPDLTGFATLGDCCVAACTRDRVSSRSPYCSAHAVRWKVHRRRSEVAVRGEEYWRRTQPAIPLGDEVSLRGLPERVIAEMLYGLQQLVAAGTRINVSYFRRLGDHLRAQQVSSIDDVDMDAFNTETRTFAKHFATFCRRLHSTPETERRNDVWDLTIFGFSGFLRFDGISQPWLRAAAKAHAYDNLPRRRRRGKDHCRARVNYLAVLSESLRVQRADNGMEPSALSRSDITAFLNQVSFLHAEGRMSGYKRASLVREVRRTLGEMRALGLNRVGQPLHGLPDDFALFEEDQPTEPDDHSAGRDLPVEVMRHLCDHLDDLEAMSFTEIRVAAELLIDTGRRPDEICQLALECLEYDGGKPVLIYDNSKADRLKRRLPIPAATAAVIERQQDRVRAQYPHEPGGQLRLLPARMRNPHGTKGLDEGNLGARHRQWVNSLPDIEIAVTDSDDAELRTFEKSLIFPHAYRHTYAQRHADAGVPVDTLRELMDHIHISTTQCYYRVGEARRRAAVDRVTAMQFDRRGNRVWRHAQSLLDSEHLRRAVGEVAVPYGMCSEPSNVAAGGTDCPVRFRCVGCAHFSTDISFLPDLEAYLADLLRTREKLITFVDADDWAINEAMPSDEEIVRVRRLISRMQADVDDLTDEEKALIEQAVGVVRDARNRVVGLGIPTTRQPLPDIRPTRSA